MPETPEVRPVGEVTIVKFTLTVPFGLNTACPLAALRWSAPHRSSYPASAKPVGIVVKREDHLVAVGLHLPAERPEDLR